MTRQKGATFTQAQANLRHALNTQQSISTKKLGQLLNALNVSLTGDHPENAELAYLKGEIRKRDQKLATMGKRLKDAKTKGVRM